MGGEIDTALDGEQIPDDWVATLYLLSCRQEGGSICGVASALQPPGRESSITEGETSHDLGNIRELAAIEPDDVGIAGVHRLVELYAGIGCVLWQHIPH